ncbi:MAG TPA: phasin family protein [Longimicrobium sp.]|nr:phasin family protein [Longimicrobium sp.]
MANATKKAATRPVPREVVERGREMAGAAREVWLAGLGVFAVAGEEGSELFARLVKSGEALEARGLAGLDERREELAEALEERVYGPVLAAVRRIAPTRADLRELTAKVDQVAHRVEALVARMTAGGPAPGATVVKVYRVFAEEEGWAVGMEGEEMAMAVLPTKGEALERARARAREDMPSVLNVYKKDGTLQETLEF